MKLKPPSSKEEMLAWLRQEAEHRWGEITPQLEQSLDSLAEAMAAISQVDLPQEFEPNLV